MKESMTTKSSIMEIKNLVMNPKLWLVTSNSEQYQFFLTTFPAKINGKIFQNKENTYRENKEKKEFSLKTLELQGFPRVYWSSNQKLFHYYQHARTVWSICSIYHIFCETHFWLCPPNNYQITINFPKF